MIGRKIVPSFDLFRAASISVTCFACFPLYQFKSAYSFSNISCSHNAISSRITCRRFVLITPLSFRYPSGKRQKRQL